MYKLDSFASDTKAGNRIIKAAEEVAAPPDFEEWFIERKFQYCQFGLVAYKPSEELALKYRIKKKTYNDWNPVNNLKKELVMANEIHQKR